MSETGPESASNRVATFVARVMGYSFSYALLLWTLSFFFRCPDVRGHWVVTTVTIVLGVTAVEGLAEIGASLIRWAYRKRVEMSRPKGFSP